MASALIYSEDMYVFLVPGQDEEFLTPPELLHKLETMLGNYDDVLPRELQKFPTSNEQATYLMTTCCDFEVSPGVSWQWYAVRLEK
jgi:Protein CHLORORESPIRATORY REDUCTION 7